MGKSLTHKIIEQHLVSGTLEAGEEIALRIDQTLTQDVTGTMAYLQFEAIGVPARAHEAVRELRGPQHAADRLRERGRPSLSAERGGEVRRLLLPPGQWDLPSGAARTLRSAGGNAARIGQPHPHLRGNRDAGHGRGRAGRGGGDGRLSVLSLHAKSHAREVDRRAAGVGECEGRDSRIAAPAHGEGRRGPRDGVRRRGRGQPLRPRARHHRELRRRTRGDVFDLRQRRTHPRIPPRGRAARADFSPWAADPDAEL